MAEQQQRLNDAHTHFEFMMGSADTPSLFYTTACEPLRCLIQVAAALLAHTRACVRTELSGILPLKTDMAWYELSRRGK
jgi:hypothetical protein